MTGRETAVAEVLGPGGRLRPAQEDALDALRERDVLLVARPGAGKTAVYAIASRLLPGLAVVVSPTLSLQRDQVQRLRAEGSRAEDVSSARTPAQQRRVLEAAARGEVDLLLLAPEQLVREEVVAALAGVEVGLLVVDEAHCVSEWGHDFRPDYLHVAAAAQRLGSPRVLAMTATAGTAVRGDVVQRLQLRDPAVVVRDVDRPEIWLGARVVASREERDEAVVQSATSLDGAGIVYARTRAEAESLAQRLTDAGRPAAAYHAGLASRRRAAVQDDFLSGRADAVVATSAFGMGVDRPDVRFVVHAGPPTSLDEYYQEVGRAGRDGEPATALLVHRAEDFALGRFLRSGGGPRASTLVALLDALDDAPGDGPGGLSRRDLATAARVSPRTASRALGALLQVGAVQERDGLLVRTGEEPAKAVAALVREDAERRRRTDATRVELVQTYAATDDCRRRMLLQLLGEEHPERCGRCDSCDAGTSHDVDDAGEHRLGERVEHPDLGPGTVASVEHDRMTVLFEEHGYKVLARELVEDRDLLAPAAAGEG